MPKYSAGSSSSGGGNTCELCGAESTSLTTTVIAGAELDVCKSCASHGTTSGSGSSSTSQQSDTDSSERKKRAAQNVAKANPIWDGDSEHWETEGTNYDDDPLPYLVSGYGSVVRDSRQAAGLQMEELAEELGIRESELLAIEQGRATQAGIGGGVITALEDRLDIQIAE